jgi:mono/diheme cytochrome c family protein
MPRSKTCLFLVALVAAFGQPIAWGEDAAADAKIAAADPDFKVQGEYIGPEKALQVVATGDEEFSIVVYEGGLPGAGASPVEPRRIDGDANVVANLIESMKLKRIERASPTLGAKPPAGAVVLFDGTQQSIDAHWKDGRISEEGWLMQGTTSKDLFRDYTLHLEFRTPWMPTESGQGRGNSGVYHQGRYETQVLDAFGLIGRMNETGGIYSVRDPDLNMCLPPLQWQTYDVEFTAARFDATGNKIANARMTVKLNDVIVQNDVEVPHATTAAPLAESAEPGPIYLQDHGAPVRYRNIWVLPKDTERESRRPIIPGFERFFAGSFKTLAEGGELLISSLACDACHVQGDQGLLPTQRGPNLSEVAGRVRPDAMISMIVDPHQNKAGTTMPLVWHDQDAQTRLKRAAAVASYLMHGSSAKLTDRVASAKVADQGEQIYHQIGCVACHESRRGAQTPASTTVRLGDLSRKYTLNSLAHFLLKPHDVRPGLRMPALTGSLQNATAIAAYLTRDVTVQASNASFQRRVYRGQWSQLPDFDKLKPVQTDRVQGLLVNDVQPNNDFGVVFEAVLPIPGDGRYTFKLSSDDGSRFLIAGNRLDNDGVHPNQTVEATFELKAGQHPIRIELFNAGGGVELELEMSDPDFGTSEIASLIVDPDNPRPVELLASNFQPNKSLVQEGERWFRSSGCANCHEVKRDSQMVTSLVVARALDQLRPGLGCLSDKVPAGAVDFELNASQVAALSAALEKRKLGTPKFDDQQRIHLTMAALNCYACHERGKLGGPEINRDSHFQTQIPEMGLEGRLPPPLDGVGDKLNDTYMVKLLNHGADLRPYMLTRMPGYQYEPLRGFHESLNRLDRSTEVTELTLADRSEPHEAIVAGGRQAVGNRGLACIKCHSFGGDNGGGIGAIDMLKMNDRLRPDWFHRYLQNPTQYRPGTRMPNSFVDGRSALTDLYDGDPTLQIDSMWQYLALGKDAKEPEGLKEGAIVLAAIDRPMIYRNFFTNVSGRGIGVGYPQNVNLIWDAEKMTLARLWKNSFIDAAMHWQDRGQGSQQPLGDAIIDFETTSSLAQIPALDAQWPTASARDRGFRFRGYRLSQAGNPTFLYSFGQITIEDTPQPTSDKNQFIRELVIHVPDAGEQPLVWQAATGKIDSKDGVYRIDRGFELQIDGIDCQLTGNADQQHLRATLPVGTTQIKETIQW